MALYRFGARRWIARIMITWGIVSAANGARRRARELSMRCVSCWASPKRDSSRGSPSIWRRGFRPQYRARMLAWFLVAIPASIGYRRPYLGPRAADGRRAGPGRLAVAVHPRGPPGDLIGIAALRVLPIGRTSRWLTRRSAQLRRCSPPNSASGRTSSLLAALKDTRVMILTVAQFGFTPARTASASGCRRSSRRRAVQYGGGLPRRGPLHRSPPSP